MTDDGVGPGHIEVGYTHLFAGLELRADRVAEEYEIEFVDGVVVRGEMLEDAGGGGVLRVEGYRTGAGTEIPERVWMVREIDGVGFTIGRAVAG